MSTQPLLGPSLANNPPIEPNPVAAASLFPSSAPTDLCSDRLTPHPPRFRLTNLIWLFGPWAIGVPLGFLIPRPGHSELPPPLDDISAVLGWVYFAAWSISFYPQIFTNFRRKSVVGLSLDFQLLNFLGFACYSVYNCALYWSPVVRKQYSLLHDGQLPAVHSNDVFFALHAAAATLVVLFQCTLYERGGAFPHRASIAAVALSTTAAAAWAAGIALFPDKFDPGACKEGGCRTLPMLTWLSWLYFLSLVKLSISFVKYVPQVVLNCRRRSTQGWNVWNVLLDFEGGLLSLSQQLMDAAACSDFTPITGNPVKFALGLVSMVFDVLFMVQHFCLFPGWRVQLAERAMADDLEKAALLGAAVRGQSMLQPSGVAPLHRLPDEGAHEAGMLVISFGPPQMGAPPPPVQLHAVPLPGLQRLEESEMLAAGGSSALAAPDENLSFEEQRAQHYLAEQQRYKGEEAEGGGVEPAAMEEEAAGGEVDSLRAFGSLIHSPARERTSFGSVAEVAGEGDEERSDDEGQMLLPAPFDQFSPMKTPHKK